MSSQVQTHRAHHSLKHVDHVIGLDGETDRNATLVRLVRAYPGLREDLVAHWCEIVLMELRAALNPESEPPCPPVDQAVAARALARFKDMEARLAAEA